MSKVIKPQTKEVKKETVEEFLARGGTIIKCSIQRSDTTTTASDFIKKDPKLKELRKLKRQTDPDNDAAHNAINAAIQERKNILKH
jgi:hypothetical protein